MKIFKNRLLIKNWLVLVCFFCVFGGAIYASINLHYIYPSSTYLLVCVDLFLVLALSYMCVSFILYPLFRTNNILNELLKNTLHELNIPLSSIQTNAKLLKDEEDKRNLQRVARIEKSCKHLQRLYSEVDYYIKKEISQVEPEIFDVKTIVEESMEEVSFIDTSICLTSELNTYKIKADKIGFHKVLLNILSNAYKYNKKNGSVHIKLDIDGNLSVEDSGIGMDNEKIFKIYDRYYQVNPSAEGYGIGLNIVKRYCDEHKIRLNITSRESLGTLVKLDLGHLKT